MKKIILIDNYDSFTFNLYHYLSSLKVDVDVFRNDQITHNEISKKKYINLLCGHFEGIDQRVIEARKIEELSIGDFILSGGETAALVVIDSILRLIPGIIGNEKSINKSYNKNMIILLTTIYILIICINKILFYQKR